MTEPRIYHLHHTNEQEQDQLCQETQIDLSRIQACSWSSDFDIAQVRPGDVLDLDEHGWGHWMWYFNGNQLFKTVGEYGQELPQEALENVLKYGAKVYRDMGLEGVSIPGERLHNTNGKKFLKSRTLSFYRSKILFNQQMIDPPEDCEVFEGPVIEVTDNDLSTQKWVDWQ